MCEECDRARIYEHHPRYDPACMYCGARYLQRVPYQKTKKDHRSHILEVWGKLGHDTARLLELALGGIPLAPQEKSHGTEVRGTGRAGRKG